MKKISCGVCNNQIQVSAKAVVSPWIRSLGVKDRRISNYAFCGGCDSGFFDYRYSDKDMEMIYSDYREDRYLGIRSKWEPWYTKSFNETHDSENYIMMRKQALVKFLSKTLSKTVKTVVDIGGDRGQYIPDLGQNQSFVIESSAKNLVDGVERLSSINGDVKFDLILFSHVLEHVANPRAELEELLRHSESVYVEVPSGLPEISRYRKSKFRLIAKLIASFFPFFWRRLSKPSTGRKSQQGFLVQSEHINFFSEKSFRTLAELLNVQVRIEVNSIQTPDKSQAFVIQCIFGPHVLEKSR